MSQHLRAALMTLGMIGIMISTIVILQVLARFVTVEMLPIILACIGVGICIFLIYMMFLDRVRYEDQIKKLVDKK